MRVSRSAWSSWASLVSAPLALACAPELEVGASTCPVLYQNEAGGAPSLRAPESEAPLHAPWSTGFEDGFCGYYDGSGFCYSDDVAGYRRVETPVHSGRFAAAFDIDAVDSGATADGSQARCVREGVLPEAAYYGAWYFVPSGTEEVDNWNLFHVQGGAEPGEGLRLLWDVSLGRNERGELYLYLYTPLTQLGQRPERPIAMDTWFHVELYLDRKRDATGEVRLYQDGELVTAPIQNVVTDPTDWGQWYVGNYASRLSPSRSTLYVDDVSVRLSR